MPKNIVIFSDGTGQDGGIRVEQRTSNVYKMYHASRIHPDNAIEPSEQVVFYDAGLGTDDSVSGLTSIVRKVRKLLQSVTGRGITKNMADCYEFVINHYNPGDRIYLIGFSRGAYTVRCLANTIMLCGVPTKDINDQRLLRFRKRIHDIAKEAVEDVYEHGAGHARGAFETERDEKARRFREKYGSNFVGQTEDTTRSNAAPYFIGVFDTVAALGASGARRLFIQLGLAVLFAFGAFLASLIPAGVLALAAFYFLEFPFFCSSLALVVLFVALSVGGFLYWQRTQYTKTIVNWPSTGERRSHQAEWKSENFDRLLSRYVGTARSANAIDETRKDFDRVTWGQPDSKQLSQMWFAGNHSDVGGSYPEVESRLSDISLLWMIEESQKLEHPIKLGPVFVNGKHLGTTGNVGSSLNLFPDASGMQHCEIAGTTDSLERLSESWPSFLRKIVTKQNYAVITRKVPKDANVHHTVSDRFKMEEVVNCARSGAYRPEALRNHDSFKQFYSVTSDSVPSTLNPEQKLS